MAVAMERVYENQKIENILNLAMDATPAERERSPELETGYDQEAGTWELIIKYSGSLEAAAPLAEEITELLNEYAIVRIREERIRELAALPEVEYIEKPKRLFFLKWKMEGEFPVLILYRTLVFLCSGKES